MKVALTVWGNRISPVFDSAQTLLVAEIINDKVVNKSFEPFDSNSSDLPENLNKMDVSVLICGAISERPASIIASSEIKLIPFVTGTPGQILDLYLSNKPASVSHFMPGYRRQGCKNGLKNAVLEIKNGAEQTPPLDNNMHTNQKTYKKKGFQNT